ncbi:hypothetical protein ABIA25_001632 [Sinorhizobium fredii]|uniref:hypothetical protein n=1 Tax=Rhizobium fredii TaxID=380 RepID=UPI0035181260
MAALVSWIIRQIGITGCIVLVLLGFYEGVPGLRDIPFVDRLPLVREFIVGRVKLEAGKAAAAATEGLVARSELKTALAKAAALEQQIRINKRMADAALKEAERSRRDAETATKELEARIAQDTGDDGCTWTDRDLEWLRAR